MCKHCYEEMSEITEVIMLYCDLEKNKENELERLCSCQRFCSKENKYIPHKQGENCRYYEVVGD